MVRIGHNGDSSNKARLDNASMRHEGIVNDEVILILLLLSLLKVTPSSLDSTSCQNPRISVALKLFGRWFSSRLASWMSVQQNCSNYALLLCQ